jgi:hypothetical protein
VALASAPVFVLGLLAVEWPFAGFLMTKAAANRFFATGYHPYSASPFGPSVMRHFVRTMHGMQFFRGIGLAMAAAAISLQLGLMFGEWMRKIQR